MDGTRRWTRFRVRPRRLTSSALVLAAPQAVAATVDFAGSLNVDGCSGSLVRMQTSADDDKAFVLTNGHCYEGSGRALAAVAVAGVVDANDVAGRGVDHGRARRPGPVWHTDV
ncbi:hypothetical protein [Amycolatopsis sp. NPDC051372]|uniref:hypothetical protein n=1 Tax=Amycolatopsis sp. NPDC051372 TaxID=3155669 RepID=UPI00343C5EA1